GITRERFAALDAVRPGYLRVLALSEKGGGILRRVKACTDIPIITKLHRRDTVSASPAAELLALDILASDIYNLIGDGAMRAGSDYRKHPFVLDGGRIATAAAQTHK
ncbi:MAG: nucleotidyltransferase family protein, partial [Clostridiales Family XIII bacterium]|nr:nucleotidyltransferase family protein [Clostridiales Family XIII bacterium]